MEFTLPISWRRWLSQDGTTNYNSPATGAKASINDSESCPYYFLDGFLGAFESREVPENRNNVKWSSNLQLVVLKNLPLCSCWCRLGAQPPDATDPPQPEDEVLSWGCRQKSPRLDLQCVKMRGGGGGGGGGGGESQIMWTRGHIKLLTFFYSVLFVVLFGDRSRNKKKITGEDESIKFAQLPKSAGWVFHLLV